MFANLVVLALATSPQTLYFVRHGETLANTSGKYNAKTLNQFSPKGAAEVNALTETLLRQPKFEMILVSPSPRTMHTIEPYLAKTGQVATIWPLLYECCTGKRPAGVQPKPYQFAAPVKISAEDRKYFRLMPGETRFPNAPTYAQGLTQVSDAEAEFRAKYAGRRILLVGHSGQGGHMIHDLTGKWVKVENAKFYQLPISQ